MKLINIPLIVFILLICGCSSENGYTKSIKYISMESIDRPANLALNQACLDVWYEFCEYSIFPEKHDNWNYEVIGFVEYMINNGCVQEKIQTVDYARIEDFTEKHAKLYFKGLLKKD